MLAGPPRPTQIIFCSSAMKMHVFFVVVEISPILLSDDDIVLYFPAVTLVIQFSAESNLKYNEQIRHVHFSSR